MYTHQNQASATKLSFSPATNEAHLDQRTIIAPVVRTGCKLYPYKSGDSTIIVFNDGRPSILVGYADLWCEKFLEDFYEMVEPTKLNATEFAAYSRIDDVACTLPTLGVYHHIISLASELAYLDPTLQTPKNPARPFGDYREMFTTGDVLMPLDPNRPLSEVCSITGLVIPVRVLAN